jgi:transposase
VCEVGNHVPRDRKVNEVVESCCILCKGGGSAECHDCWYRRSFLAAEDVVDV